MLKNYVMLPVCTYCMRDVRCPAVISMLPMYICKSCNTVSGFWSYLWFYVMRPVEKMVLRDTKVYITLYTTNYLHALYHHFTDEMPPKQ